MIIRANLNGAITSLVAPFSPARKAAIDKAMARYLTLDCGHITSREVALLYSVFASEIKDVFCETHNEFRKLSKSQQKHAYPVNPAF